MRLLVHGDSLGPGMERMRLAAWGLGLRGHDVRWLGRNAPCEDAEAGASGQIADLAPEDGRSPLSRGTRVIRNRGEPARGGADLVIGSDRSLGALTFCGWRAGAHGMVAALDPERKPTWSIFERWCWSSLDSSGMVEVSARDRATALEPERLDTWSTEPPPRSPEIAHPDVDGLERACEKTLARRRGEGLSPAVFVDRDGTLVIERVISPAPMTSSSSPGLPRPCTPCVRPGIRSS
jgi:hypothetical protein